MTRLRGSWFAIVAFLPLYAIVGAILRARPGVAIDRPAMLYAGLAALFAALALVLRPVLVRAGVHPDPAHMVAWAAAEAVAIVGLAAWIESGDVRAYALAATVSFVLMALLFPRSTALPVDAGGPRE